MLQVVNGLLLRDGQILMALRAPDRPRYPNTWSFPGGGVEDGETLEEALFRELNEEIGIVPVNYELLKRIVTSEPESGQAITFHLFAIRNWKGEIDNLGSEHAELRWVPVSKAGAFPNLALTDYLQIFEALS